MIRANETEKLQLMFKLMDRVPNWDEVNAALGRVIASVPESQVMDVYNAVKDIMDPQVPAYMKSLVNGPDAEKAYEGFLAFKDVVKSQQVSSAGPAATVPSGDAIGAAATKLSDASYPFLKEIDWLSDIYLRPLPGAAAHAALGGVIASVPKQTVIDVYNSFAGLVDSSVPNNMFKSVNALDANAAAKAFYTFKDVVAASQR